MWRTGSIGLLATASLALAVPATQAQTSKCRAGKYLASVATAPLKVERLRAVNLPTKTDGYAPPCLVADAAASAIQDGSASDLLPKTLTLYGARWYGGKWKCSYRGTNGGAVSSATCKKRGAERRKITMQLSTR